MSATSVYHHWIPAWVKTPLLILALFPHLMLMSLFHSNTTFSASFLGAEPEDIQFLLSLMYGSVVAALLIFGRFFSFFRLRSYIILMCAISTLILFLLSITKDYNLVMGLRILEGIFGLMEGACFIPLLIGQLKSRQVKTIAYLILYAVMLTGGTLTTSLLKYAILDFGWEELIYIVMFFHVIVLLITATIFNNNRLLPKKPLYQVDFTSVILLLVTLHSGSYAILYGKKYYWFESPWIVAASLVCIVFSIFFVLRQRSVKRPVFEMKVFKYRNIIIGLSLIFIFYLIRSALNNVYAMMSTVWGWPWEYVLNVQYINVAGTAAGILFSGIALHREYKSTYIFAMGFLLLAVDCGWFALTMYPDTTILAIGPPLLLQGVAQGLLFTPLVMYLLSGMPINLASSASLTGTAIRFWTTNIGFAVMQNLSYWLNKEHFSVLQRALNPASYLAQQAVTSSGTATIINRLNRQATLLSNMEIFSALMWLSIATAAVILLFKPSKSILRKMGIKRAVIFG